MTARSIAPRTGPSTGHAWRCPRARTDRTAFPWIPATRAGHTRRPGASPLPAAAPAPAGLEQRVEATIAGIHAYRLKLTRASGKGDPACWTSPLSDAALDALVAHQAALLAGDMAAAEPLLAAHLPMADTLPVNVFTAWLAAHAPDRPRAHIRAVANLYQTVLEVERDGDRLQDLYRFYIALGLAVYVGPFGLPGRDADLLAAGRDLEGRGCASA